jgi:hypothetical protein
VSCIQYCKIQIEYRWNFLVLCVFCSKSLLILGVLIPVLFLFLYVLSPTLIRKIDSFVNEYIFLVDRHNVSYLWHLLIVLDNTMMYRHFFMLVLHVYIGRQ